MLVGGFYGESAAYILTAECDSGKIQGTSDAVSDALGWGQVWRKGTARRRNLPMSRSTFQQGHRVSPTLALSVEVKAWQHRLLDQRFAVISQLEAS